MTIVEEERRDDMDFDEKKTAREIAKSLLSIEAVFLLRQPADAYSTVGEDDHRD